MMFVELLVNGVLVMFVELLVSAQPPKDVIMNLIPGAAG